MRSSLLIGVKKERLVVMVDGKWVEPQHQGNDESKLEFKRICSADTNEDVEALHVWSSSSGCIKRKSFVTKAEQKRRDESIAKQKSELSKLEAKAKDPKSKE